MLNALTDKCGEKGIDAKTSAINAIAFIAEVGKRRKNETFRCGLRLKATSNNSKFVTPVKTGVQSNRSLLDSGFRRNDNFRGTLNCLEPFLNFEPTALEAIIQKQSSQVSHSHVPHCNACGDNQNEKVLFLKFNVLHNQGQLHTGKKEEDT